uniref:Uncharacterized protein n=1 Tax=Meloidogyne enterolobii TaxID=390850 RepID=A0A6V7Y1M4_MELEN|nr:unnamed protein product [Meloidogyne enterolobii]
MSDGLLFVGTTKEKFRKLNKGNHNVEYKIREMLTNNFKKPIKPLPISLSFLNKFKKSAKMLKEKSTLPGNFILFGGVLNQAYLELTMNWLCNIYGLPKIKKIGKNNKKRQINLNEGNIELLNVTLFVGLDSGKICSQINKSWPQVFFKT